MHVEPAQRRPGQMTAVMRAMAIAAGPKVIRVGVVRAGRVIEERVIKQRITVTVGTSETAMFVIPATAGRAGAVVPPVLALFERSGDDYYLNVLGGMKGRLALSGGITDIASEAAQRIKLTEEARGKVVIGDTTLLFQFVAPPPAASTPQLPLAVKGGLAMNHDWALTMIVAFSFLIHFGLVGGMYSDWSDPIVGDRYDVGGLVDMMGKVPPPPIEVPAETAGIATPKAPDPPATYLEKERPPSAPDPKTQVRSSHATPGPMSDERSAQLAASAEAMQMQVVAGINAGPAVQGALDRSNVPGIDLTSAAERNVGAVRGDGQLKTASGVPVQASNRGGLSTLGGPTKTDGTGTTAGTAAAVAGPTAIAQIGTPTTSMPLPGADATVAGLRSRFRSCYQTGLLLDSSMSGKVLVSAKIGPNGEVTSSDIVSISGLSPAVGQCIAGVVKRATFSAPPGGSSTLQIPVTFVQQTK